MTLKIPKSIYLSIFLSMCRVCCTAFYSFLWRTENFSFISLIIYLSYSVQIYLSIYLSIFASSSLNCVLLFPGRAKNLSYIHQCINLSHFVQIYLSVSADYYVFSQHNNKTTIERKCQKRPCTCHVPNFTQQDSSLIFVIRQSRSSCQIWFV